MFLLKIRISRLGTPKLSKEQWIGVLKLSRMWDMPEVCQFHHPTYYIQHSASLQISWRFDYIGHSSSDRSTKFLSIGDRGADLIGERPWSTFLVERGLCRPSSRPKKNITPRHQRTGLGNRVSHCVVTCPSHRQASRPRFRQHLLCLLQPTIQKT